MREPRPTKPIRQQHPKQTAAPANQYITEKFPVLTFGGTPRIDLATWRLRLFGALVILNSLPVHTKVGPKRCISWVLFKDFREEFILFSCRNCCFR